MNNFFYTWFKCSETYVNKPNSTIWDKFYLQNSRQTCWNLFSFRGALPLDRTEVNSFKDISVGLYTTSSPHMYIPDLHIGKGYTCISERRRRFGKRNKFYTMDVTVYFVLISWSRLWSWQITTFTIVRLHRLMRLRSPLWLPSGFILYRPPPLHSRATVVWSL